MVLGVGVAGLAAIGTANAFGCVVRAWDVRDISDQVPRRAWAERAEAALRRFLQT